jgi:hypothetical protein
MKTNLMITLASAAIMASSVAIAAPVSVSDSDLAQITGKDQNSASFSSSATVNITSGSGNGNVQVGFYQWFDKHTQDTSNAKGGNTANGDTSSVQASVSGDNNIFGWGAAAQVATTTSSITDVFDSESWGTLMLGGF